MIESVKRSGGLAGNARPASRRDAQKMIAAFVGNFCRRKKKDRETDASSKMWQRIQQMWVGLALASDGAK